MGRQDTGPKADAINPGPTNADPSSTLPLSRFNQVGLKLIIPVRRPPAYFKSPPKCVSGPTFRRALYDFFGNPDSQVPRTVSKFGNSKRVPQMEKRAKRDLPGYIKLSLRSHPLQSRKDTGLILKSYSA